MITTSVGKVTVKTVYGQDPETGKWLNSMRILWGLEAHQEMSPVLEEKICFTATQAGSYESAARIAEKWGVEVDDSTIHHHVQQAGARAEAHNEERVDRALDPETRSDVIKKAGKYVPFVPFSLVIMMDGWMVRERGPQWGLKPAEIEADRVEWHEMKSGIIFRVDQRVEDQSGRRMILEKRYVSWRGDPYEFGRRLYAEALRYGLVQAKHVYVVADGAIWIWNIVEDRFSEAVGVLDFYHASQHLWAVARELYEEDDEAARWVNSLLHQLNQGEEERVLECLGDLLYLCANMEANSSEIVNREVKYFNNHREHLHYERAEKEGCPKGSGAMESSCSQFQDRFKRTGQFWTRPGENSLMALELARRNDDWDEIWEIPLVA